MHRIARHQQRGFTLAEILVTTAIFAIIMIAALTVYDRSNRVFKSGTESADLQQSTRIGFDKLVSDLRMAGFDYNRGGAPTGNGQFPQFDEQIEYAGTTAVVFRANFNYNTASATGNGLEPAYTPLDPMSGSPIFPYVTTSNDEIVAYVVRSADNTKNTRKISFYVDSSKPRSAYPGGSAESLITISNALCSTCGIDTTNANPPYTLYRETLSDILSGLPGTPVSENIRSINFFYYTDLNGATVLKNNDGPPATDIASTRDADGSTSTPATATFVNQDGTTTTLYTGAIGGAGQYDPNSPGTAANYGDRQSRTTIASIRVNLVGMNANPDPSYSLKTETIASIKSYRQYQLSALVVPRNLGLTGFPEPSNSAPSPPTITGICSAACAAPVICWAPPAGGGAVEQYRIEWDTNVNGAFASSLTITDPSATTAIIPDTGAIDPSLTWYYHIIAQNENGSSLPSQVMSIQPKNSTKPMAPAVASITTANATNYAITLGWTSPSTNDPSVATATCVGAGCTTDATKIPPQEQISYRIYRGVTPNFDPSVAGQSVPVLTTGGASQPIVTSPGSPVVWNDSPTTSAYPPGTCTQYYYRMQAADRCVASNSYNASNNLNDSLSTLAPLVGQSATVAVMANDVSSAQATAPLAFKANTATSVCPAPSSTNCEIDLQWGKTITDSAGNAIGVDRYRLTRYRKKQADPSFVLDTTFNGSGTLDVKGFSQASSGTATYSDLSAVAIDTVDSKPWYYEYSVAANDCRLGQVSARADFPTPCSVNPIIVESGASNAGATADSPGTAWIMNAGDSINVSPPGGVTLTSVKFDVTTYPAGTAVDSQTKIASPFTYTWSDRSDNQIYTVKITVVTSTGCTEIHIKYVQDQPAASCSFASQGLVAYSSATAGSTTTLSETYTVTNTGTDPMQVASEPISVTWVIPAGDTTHNDITIDSIAYPATTDNFTGVGPGTISRTIPASIGNIAGSLTLSGTVATAGTTAIVGTGTHFTTELAVGYAIFITGEGPRVVATITNDTHLTLTAAAATTASGLSATRGGTLAITIRWQYRKQDDPPALAGQPLTKVCLAYAIASEPGVTKFCNLVGQAASSNNPGSCD
ncbi:MAG TPA: prepilin-type N-terminal cleavage/methylation domain-containing protein [Thermoanaerobaculia bacterium]|jgi:prepilin-type N-terminal cleavage/methylation domain-containing protein|nr:prepilin-type N-terminal cleavage/methylation domain-containing protein [Thermoanaerobaculia bacterium]